MLKVKINKIHSASAVRTVNFRKYSAIDTYAVVTESETGSNDTDIYILKMFAMNVLSFPFATQFLKMQLYL